MTARLITEAVVLEALGIRIAEGDHLVKQALSLYVRPTPKAEIRKAADHNRKVYAEAGRYLQALIHDQIYRLAGGED